ncbi:hypothetical protein BN14_02539 [Rhizoctonia solani AG-1 IB]|uniref:Uncharacterized protein n=1 Tax=Thanatephorus cucumeris (strain AG1-IB / isolate 7/3/14) TaxID=1108050 RepID=M5BND5_THACB|nr:hypothetical protein BN14_02539 [Rhizoctonia solani AG-1 IB]
MTNLKRKKGAAGCSKTESSCGEAERPPEPPKSKQQLSISDIKRTRVPLSIQTATPSRAQSQPTTNPLATPAAHQSSSKANPKLKVPSTPLHTLDPEASSFRKSRQATVANSSDESLPDSPVVSMRQKVDKHTALSSDDEHPLPAPTLATRGLVQLERDLNGVRSDLDNLGTHFSERIDKLESKIDTLLTLQLKQAGAASATSMSLETKEEKKIAYTNPPPNLAHYAMAEDIQKRRERDKASMQIPDQYKSQSLTLARNVVKSMLDITKVTTDAPDFYYTGLQPNYFPVHLKDATGYIRPAPNWSETFASNYPWFTTYIDRFRKMATNMQSAFGHVASQYTDQQILVLLHDGPFSSLVAAWKREHQEERAKKAEKNLTGEDERNMDEKAKKRATKRLEAKAFARQAFRDDARLEAMAGSRWGAAWSKSVMSPTATDSEKGDNEGGLVVYRYDWMAGWMKNLNETFDNAERAKELAKPGPRRPPTKRRFKTLAGNPPTIFTGKGENKKLVRIPLVMISKRWQQIPANAAWMKASSHLIDSSLDRKPDIIGFLSAYPAPAEPDHYDGEDEDEEDSEDEDKGKGENKKEDKDKNEEAKAEGKLGFEAGLGAGEAEEDDETGLGVAGPGYNPCMPVTNSLEPTGKSKEDDLYASDPAPIVPSHPLATAPSTQREGNIAIDPQILQSPPRAWLHATNRTNQTTYVPGDALHTELESHLEPPPPQSGWPNPNPGPTMSPPPTLSQQERAEKANTASSAPKPTKASKTSQKLRTKRNPVEETPAGPLNSAVTQAANPTVNVPKSRGRPKGSKNKKTLEKERIAAEEAAKAAKYEG